MWVRGRKRYGGDMSILLLGCRPYIQTQVPTNNPCDTLLGSTSEWKPTQLHGFPTNRRPSYTISTVMYMCTHMLWECTFPGCIYYGLQENSSIVASHLRDLVKYPILRGAGEKAYLGHSKVSTGVFVSKVSFKRCSTAHAHAHGPADSKSQLQCSSSKP